VRLHRSLSTSTCLLMLTTIAGSAVLTSHPAYAFRNGLAGFSGRTGVICNSCHAGGTAPTVDFEGPMTVAPGSTNTYRFNVRSQASGQTNAGLDVAVCAQGATSCPASTSGQLAVDSAQNARVTGGEIVHNSPKANVDGVATWEFTWTAPAAAGSVTMYGAGNSVNGDDSSLGDRATSVTFAIAVAAAVDTPTPSPTPTVPIGNSPTPTATSGPIACVGDCDQSGVVVVNELVTGVNIALDRAEITACPDFDTDDSGSVTVNELVSGVNALLRGCVP
jgi:hypothetical protein